MLEEPNFLSITHVLDYRRVYLGQSRHPKEHPNGSDAVGGLQICSGSVPWGSNARPGLPKMGEKCSDDLCGSELFC